MTAGTEHTVESLSQFLDDLDALELRLKALREPFGKTRGLGYSLDDEMVSACFGNMENAVDKARHHARLLRDHAGLRRAATKQAAE